jgi:hypothetical protein
MAGCGFKNPLLFVMDAPPVTLYGNGQCARVTNKASCLFFDSLVAEVPCTADK